MFQVLFTQLLEAGRGCDLFSKVSQCCLVPSLTVWVYVDSGEKRTYVATKNYMDKIQILFPAVMGNECKNNKAISHH